MPGGQPRPVTPWWWSTRTGVVTGWSEGAQLLTGYAAADVTGRPVSDLLDGDPGEAWRALRANGGHGVVPVRREDGRRTELALRAYPLQGLEGAPAGYVITAAPDGQGRDLGELAFKQASVSMSVFDTEQRYLRMNDTACRIMGVQEAEVLYRYFPAHRRERGAQPRLLQPSAPGGRDRPPRPLRELDPGPSGLRMHAWNIEMWPLRAPSGQLLGVSLAGYDSTEQYRARQRLALLSKSAAAIGTMLDVIHTARELAQLAVPELAIRERGPAGLGGRGRQEPTGGPGGSRCGAAPGRARLPYRRGAGSGDRPGRGGRLPVLLPPVRALVTGHAVLTRTGDPDVDGWLSRHGAQAARPHQADRRDFSLMAVPLVARGTTLGWRSS